MVHPLGAWGVIEHVDHGARLAYTLEGNVGAFRAKVRRRQWDMDRPGRLELVARI